MAEAGESAGYTVSTQVLFDLADLFQAPEAFAFSLALRQWRRSWRARRRERVQAYPPDLEVFFKPLRLEQIGEFEGAHITAPLADFALQVADDPAQIVEGETRSQPLSPL